MNFYVAEATLVGWENAYVVFEKNVYDAEGNVIDVVTEKVTSYAEATTSQGVPARVYSFAGITSVEMCSEVNATLHASYEGVERTSKTIPYSVLSYVTTMLPYANGAFRDLLVDMVRYGAAAQTYWNYNTANLATKNLTAAQQKYGHTTEPTVANNLSTVKNPNATVGFSSVGLSLEDRVTMTFALNLSRYTGDVEDLKVVATYGGKTVEITDLKYMSSNGGVYCTAELSTLTAAELRTVVSAEIYSKSTGQKLSSTLNYSAETYACSMLGNAQMKPVLVAMMNYGDSAKAYFG